MTGSNNLCIYPGVLRPQQVMEIFTRRLLDFCLGGPKLYSLFCPKIVSPYLYFQESFH